MKCENCDKEHDGSYGSGRFCCFECKQNYCSKPKPNKEYKCIWDKKYKINLV